MSMTNWLPATGTMTSTPAKQQQPTKPKESVSEGMKELSIAEPVRIKSKNLDVIAEYRKVERKNAANFVVIGVCFTIIAIPSINQYARPCGRWKKHSDGPPTF